MPWEVTIRMADGSVLGDIESVLQQISTAIADIQFIREPSGPERIASARDAGLDFPDIIRRHFESLPAKVSAVFEGDQFSMTLYGFEAQPLQAFHAEIRGEGNPVPILSALCRPHRWVAIDDTSGGPVDLSGSRASGWEEFQSFRDHAVRSIKASEIEEHADPNKAPDGGST